MKRSFILASNAFRFGNAAFVIELVRLLLLFALILIKMRMPLFRNAFSRNRSDNYRNCKSSSQRCLSQAET